MLHTTQVYILYFMFIGGRSYWQPTRFFALVGHQYAFWALKVNLTPHNLLSYWTYRNISLCYTPLCTLISQKPAVIKIQYHYVIFMRWLALLLASICMSLCKLGFLHDYLLTYTYFLTHFAEANNVISYYRPVQTASGMASPVTEHYDTGMV